MSIIPHLRLIFVLLGLGMLYWLFNNMLDSIIELTPRPDDVFFLMMHGIWAGLILVIAIVVIARYLIEVRRRSAF